MKFFIFLKVYIFEDLLIFDCKAPSYFLNVVFLLSFYNVIKKTGQRKKENDTFRRKKA